MKSFIKVLLISCLFLGLSSCIFRHKGAARPKADLQPIVTTSVDSSRRQIGGAKEGASQIVDKTSQRRSVSTVGIEKVAKPEKPEEEKSLASEVAPEKSVAVFEPFDPEKAKQEALEKPEEGLPDEIRKELLGAEEEEEEYLTLNFEQAPIEQILNAASETLGINFIMTPGVKGAITMQTSKPVPASELFQILQSVLEVNGLTLVPSGRYYKVVVGKEAKNYPIKVVSGKEGESLPSEDSFITQIIPLDYIPVKDMVNIINPFLSKSAPPVIQHEELNILIINDLSSNLKRLLRFVQELDKPLYQPKEKVYVYYIENSDADKLASTLNSIYKEQDKTKRFPFSPMTGEKQQQQEQQQPQPQQIIQTPFGPMVAPEQVSGDIRITADKEINALIIVTSPRNYPSVLETIKKLDIMPKQALIEALIVDVTLTDSTEFGIGWWLKGTEQSIGANFKDLANLNSSVPSDFSNIFGYKLITESGHFAAFIRQLSTMTKMNVVSSPYIIALDNQKASIHITEERPIRNETVDQNTGLRTYNFTYKSVGLKLDVTPKINENNMITLELEQEVSEIAGEVYGGDAVITNSRNATSKVVVKDGQTIIIGGLIQNRIKKSKDGIPFFSDIPVIGRLFGNTADTLEKTELLLFLTPHVIADHEDAEKITADFEKKIDFVDQLTKDSSSKNSKQ